MSAASAVRSADVEVLSGGAMRRFLIEAVPLFEQSSGARVAMRFGLTRDVKAEIEAGAGFDVALLPRPAIDGLVAAGKIAVGTPTDAVRSVVGLMVRTGAPKPDIGTVNAFKKALRAAKSISYSKGPSGLYVADLLERLGLAAEMSDKTVFAIGRPVGAVVAGGEAEIGMQQIIENQPVRGPTSLAHCRANSSISCSIRPVLPLASAKTRSPVLSLLFWLPPRRCGLFAPRAWSRGDRPPRPP